jgi:hypothetical protein
MLIDKPLNEYTVFSDDEHIEIEEEQETKHKVNEVKQDEVK